MKTNKEFWDSYSSEFDAIYGTRNTLFNSIINRFFRDTMKIRFERTVQMIPEERVSVLDIGCGPGHYCFTLAKRGSREILGIDFSGNMIALAKKHAKDSGIENTLKFEVVNFTEFNPGKKFDFSIMMGFIEYFESPAAILKKAVSLTNKKIFISFPVAGGILAFQRKLRYRRRCFLKFYYYEDIRMLMEELDIISYKIEKIKRDFFVTINMQ